MTADEMRNWVPRPSNPTGGLPNLGNGINYHPMYAWADALQGGSQHPWIDFFKNQRIDGPMGGLLGNHTQDLINKGLLNFNLEVPGVNSNRLFFGLTRRF